MDLTNENSIKLLLISELIFPFTRQILFGNRLCSDAIDIKLVSSLKGIINVKIPCEESNLETALVRSLKDRLSVNRALFLALFSDLKLSL